MILSTPFLRWTGSKRWFVKEHLDKLLPDDFKNYHEPFLGGGSVFFHMRMLHADCQTQYFLSDSNPDLINCYVQIRDNVSKVLSELCRLENSHEAYYHIRSWNPKLPERKAAKFIYLNRTAFNGIYRVNSQGKFNVPYSKRRNVDIVTQELLTNVSKILQDVKLNESSFENTIENINEKDLVFIDPPYTVAHENNGFIEYNKKLFSWEDQLKLKKFTEEIKSKNAYFIQTNASHTSIHDLYEDLASISKVSRESKVGGRVKTRGLYNELIIHNISR